MKAIWVLLLACMATFSYASDWRLVFATDSFGYAGDNKSIDISGIGANDRIIVEVWVDNASADLAGLEVRLDFLSQSLSMEDMDADFQDGDAPYKAGDGWGAASLQLLPSNSSGQQTAATVNNSFGTFRLGALVTDPGTRPAGDGSSYRVATVELIASADCSTSSTSISLFVCGSNGDECDIIADPSAQRVSAGNAGNTADYTVTVNNSASAYIAGDLDDSATLSIGDVISLLNCILGNEFCTQDTDPDYADWTDVNCDGSVNPSIGDVVSLLNLILQNTGRSVQSKGAFASVSGAGSVVIDNSNAKAAAFQYEIPVNGNVRFEPIKFTESGWMVSSAFRADTNVFRVVGINSSGTDRTVPSLEINYTADEGSSIGSAVSEYVNQSGATGIPGIVVGTPEKTLDDDRRRQ